MSNESDNPHINFGELVKVRIPALGKRGAENNKAILRKIAMDGPALKYDVCKSFFPELPLSHYGTISRRMDALKKCGYLAEAGKRRAKRGKQTKQSLYGLTWRGFIASLSIAEVRKNILLVLEKNPLLAMPEKELVLPALKNTFTQQETEKITESWLYDFLNRISNIEIVGESELQLFIFVSAMKELSALLENTMKRENLLKLLDIPMIFQYAKEKIPSLKGAFERQLQALSVSISILDGIQKVFDSMEPEELASEKLDEFFGSIVANRSTGE